MAGYINYAAIEALCTTVVEEHVRTGGLPWLDEALSHPGSGVQHHGNPNPSSIPGEMPAPQTEALRRSLDVRVVAPLAVALGSFEDQDAEGYAHALSLESSPASKNGRPFLEMTAADSGFHAALVTGTP